MRLLSTRRLFLIGALFAKPGDQKHSRRITAATFSTAVIGSLLLLDKIDSNRIKEAYLEHGMSNESLRSLGKM